MKTKNIVLFLFFFVALGSCVNLYAQTTGFHLIKKTLIGGEGGWDYIHADSEKRRLFISHGDQVEVVDIDSHKILGVIKNTKGVHGIDVANGLGKGFITNGKANTVSIFDVKSLKVISEVKAGVNPDALLYDKFSGRVFIFNNDSRDITVIDAASGKVDSTFSVGGNPEAGISDDKGTIFVNVEDTNELVAFEAKTLAIKSKWSLPGDEPNGLVFDKTTNRIFSACRKSQLLFMVDANTGKVVAQVPTGKGVDGVAFDPDKKNVFVSNGEGSVTVVHEDSSTAMSVSETVTTEPGARTIAFDTKKHHVFVVTAQYGEAPAPTAENPRPWRTVVPGTFVLLEYGVN